MRGRCGCATVRSTRSPSAFPLCVCGMNLALCDGILAGMGAADRRARLDPRPGECCVVVGSKTS